MDFTVFLILKDKHTLDRSTICNALMEVFSSVQWRFEVVLTAIAFQGTPWNNKKVVWETFWKGRSRMVVGIINRKKNLHLVLFTFRYSNAFYILHYELQIKSTNSSFSWLFNIRVPKLFRYLSSNPLKIRHELNMTKTVKKKGPMFMLSPGNCYKTPTNPTDSSCRICILKGHCKVF